MDENVIDIVARSDADFDGRPYDGLGRADRERYRDRARASLAALRRHGPPSVAAALALHIRSSESAPAVQTPDKSERICA